MAEAKARVSLSFTEIDDFGLRVPKIIEGRAVAALRSGGVLEEIRGGGGVLEEIRGGGGVRGGRRRSRRCIKRR